MVKPQPYKRLKWSTPELRAHLNRTNDHQKKEGPHLKTWPKASPDHVTWCKLLSTVLSWKGNCCRGFKLCRPQSYRITEKMRPHGGQLFQHSLDRWVKIKVRPAVSLRKDCSEQVCGSCWICHGGMNPSGNACLSRRAKQRLDLWIYISDVECIWRAKTLQLHLTGMGRWKDPRNFEKVCHVQF